MKYLFSPRKRFSTWRELWLWLAESQKGTILSLPLLSLNGIQLANWNRTRAPDLR